MKRIFIIVALSTLVTACANEAFVESKIKGELVPLTVNSISIAATTTKATTSISTDGNKFGSFFDGDVNFGYEQKALEYEYASSTTSWKCNTVNGDVMLNSEFGDFAAYYPLNNSYISPSGDPTAITLTSKKFETTEDFYTKSVKVNNKNAKVDLTEMKHVYSQITFKIMRDAIYPTDNPGAITEIKLLNSGFCTTGKFNLLTGTYTPDESSAGSFSFNPAIATLPVYDATSEETKAATVVKTSIIVLPIVEITTAIVVKMTLDGLEFSTEIPTTFLPKLLPGVNYTIGLAINGIKLFVNDKVVEEDWKDPVAQPDPVYPQ